MAIAHRPCADQYRLRAATQSAVVGLLFWMTTSAPFAQEVPIYQQEPFDVLTLNNASGGAQLKIVPLDLPGRSVPQSPDPASGLRIRLLSRPEEEYEVLWRDIEKLELFEHLVLAKAESLAADGKFAEAFDHYEHLWRQYGESAGFVASYHQFLVNNAFASFRAGRWEDALVELAEVRRREPNRPGLAAALARVNDKLVETYVEERNYAAARHILRRAAEKADELPLGDLYERWAGRLAALARTKMAEAQSHRAAGRLREANLATRQMLDIWPELEGARQLADDVQREYPFVLVGVTQPALNHDPRSIDNWSARRAGRLRHRMLMEFVHVGAEGGQYACPVGALVPSEDGRQLTLRLLSLDRRQTAGGYTGYELSRLLLAMADPTDPSYVFGWDRLLAGVNVSDVNTVEVDLERPHLRIEALLRSTLSDRRSATAQADTGPLNPYRVASQVAEESRFVVNAEYLRASQSQPREIVEMVFADPGQATKALERGQIDLVDRVFPADVPRLRNLDLIVEPYAVPTLHMLVPNFKRPYLADRQFRRALVYGIDRETILEREILGGVSMAGCRVISGPLPPGASQVDPLGYGYDMEIAPRPYDPRLAYVLAQVAVRNAAEQAKKIGGSPPAEPSLILVHPADEVARTACHQIAEQLSAIGIACQQRELAPGRSSPPNDQWDLLYVEAWMAEPLSDVERLLDVDGLTRGGSPYLDRALQLLDQADNWNLARRRLLELHRVAHDEVVVVPLWQLVDHLAYRRTLSGIGSQPATLYQDVEGWHYLSQSSAPSDASVAFR